MQFVQRPAPLASLNPLVLLLLLLTSTPARAQIPATAIPDSLGVNIHFTSGRTRDLDLMAAAGFKLVRIDFAWEATEKPAGTYDWSDYDALARDLRARGLRAIFILDYSHSAYETNVAAYRAVGEPVPEMGTASPRHAQSIAAFARWAAAAAQHFRDDHIIWEIFNEPNGNFWKPKPDAHEYTALALATAQAIRQAQPDATIVGPALAGMDWGFLEVFLASGILTNLDAVSVHPYRDNNQPPETAGPDYKKIREMTDRYAPAAKKGKIPILSGEWGYHSSRHGVSTQTQAAYAVRQQLFNLMSGIPLSIWYDWKNDGTDPNDGEQNFGVVTDTLEPKPAYTALQDMTRALAGFHFQAQLAQTNQNDYVILLTKPGGSFMAAAWTTSAPHEIRAAVGDKAWRTMTVSNLPVYFAP